MHVNMTITVNETEARELWSRFSDDEGDPPIERDLANWLSDFCATTIQSNFQFDAGVDPVIEAEGRTETLRLLEEIGALDNYIDSRWDQDTAALDAAKARREQIKTALGLSDEPKASEDGLEELLAAYGPLLGTTQPADESGVR